MQIRIEIWPLTAGVFDQQEGYVSQATVRPSYTVDLVSFVTFAKYVASPPRTPVSNGPLKGPGEVSHKPQWGQIPVLTPLIFGFCDYLASHVRSKWKVLFPLEL